MTKTEFLSELYRLLDGMPEEERKAAVSYYEDYFADAGEEHEQEVMRELGSPEKVAASIRADYFGTEFHEEDYEWKAYPEHYGAQQAPRTSRGVKILLIALIVLAVVPAFWRILVPVFCVVIGLICAVIGIFAGLVVGSAALMLAGLGMVLSAVPMVFDILPMAFLIGGLGLLIFVVGLMAVVGTVKLCMVVYPAMFRGFINLCRRPFYGKAV